jgi:hypothetical protein
MASGGGEGGTQPSSAPVQHAPAWAKIVCIPQGGTSGSPGSEVRPSAGRSNRARVRAAQSSPCGLPSPARPEWAYMRSAPSLASTHTPSCPCFLWPLSGGPILPSAGG